MRRELPCLPWSRKKGKLKRKRMEPIEMISLIIVIFLNCPHVYSCCTCTALPLSHLNDDCTYISVHTTFSSAHNFTEKMCKISMKIYIDIVNKSSI